MAEETLQQRRERHKRMAQARINAQESIIIENESKPSQLGVLGRAGLRGGSYNFADEVGALVQGAGDFINKPVDLEPGGLIRRGQAAKLGYDASLLESKAQKLEDINAFPKTEFAGEVLGGGVTGYGTLKALNQSNRISSLPFIPRVLGVGAGEGALFGAGAADPGERLGGAALGALTGAIGTPIAAGVGVSAMSVLRPSAKRLGTALFGTPKDRAKKEILKALQADDITPQEADVLMRMHGINTILPDLGPTLARQGRTITTELGPAASKGKRFLDARQRTAQLELRQTARRATGSDNFDKGIIEIVNGAESKAAPIYKEVFSEVLDLTPTMKSILERPAMVAARKKAGVMLNNEGFSDEFLNDVTDVRYMDAIKRALGDQESAAIRSGNGNQARVLGQLRRDFVAEIDAQVPRYAEARSIFAGEQAMKDAAETGRTMFVGNKNVADVAEQIGNMGESELEAARIGFLDWLENDIASTSIKSNRLVNKFADVPKFKQLIQVLFPDQAAVDDFMKVAAAKSKFGETKNFILGGSQTANKQADFASMEPGLFNVAANAAVDPVSGLASAMRLIKGNTSLTPEVLTEMGNILFNPRIIPSVALKRNVMAPLFEIPKLSSASTAGISGGLIGSQQDDILGRLREAGLLGN